MFGLAHGSLVFAAAAPLINEDSIKNLEYAVAAIAIIGVGIFLLVMHHRLKLADMLVTLVKVLAAFAVIAIGAAGITAAQHLGEKACDAAIQECR
jgi:hypothetical protein